MNYSRLKLAVGLFAYLAICNTSVLFSQVDADNAFREWQSTKGSVIAGRLESTQLNAQNEQIAVITVLKKVSSKSDVPEETQIEVRLSDLSAADNKYIAAKRFIEQDKLQFDVVAQEIEALRNTEDSAIETLKTLSKQFKDAPYAAVWAGVALAAIKNDPQEAIEEFDDAIKRCKAQREFDKFRHRRTLIAALNNKAVALIKLKDEPKAAQLLVQALSLVERVPPVLVHNVNQLLERTSTRGFPKARQIRGSEREQLILAKTRFPYEDVKKKMQAGFYYSLHMDAPSSSGNEFSVDQIEPPDESLELIATGTGIVIAKGHVLTVLPVVSHPSRSASLATVALPRGDKRWVLRPATSVVAYQPKKRLSGGSSTSTIRSENVNSMSTGNSQSLSTSSSSVASSSARTSPPRILPGQVIDANLGVRSSDNTRESVTSRSNESSAVNFGNSTSVTTTYSYVNSADSSPEAELAVIQIPGLDIAPITFLSSEVLNTEEISVLGFNRGFDMLTKGLGESKGVIISGDHRKLTTALVPGGSRGGPVVNKSSGDVLGIVWNSLNDKRTGARGEFFDVSDVRLWLDANVQTVDLQPRDPADKDLDGRLKRIKAATVPILTWGKKSDLSNSIYQSYYNEDNLINLFLVRDQWCFNCQGKGVLKCGDCRGKGDHQNGTVRVGNGVNPVNGVPMYQDVPNIVPCRTCESSGKLRCTFCKDGKMPGGALPQPQQIGR